MIELKNKKDSNSVSSLRLPSNGLILFRCSNEERDLLVRALCLEGKDSSYSCLFDGQDLSSLSHRDKEDFVFHNISVIDCSSPFREKWTLEKNLLFAQGNQPKNQTPPKETIQKTFEAFKLENLSQKVVSGLSPAQKKIAQYARALARETPLNIILNASDLLENDIIRRNIQEKKKEALFLAFSDSDLSLSDVDQEYCLSSDHWEEKENDETLAYPKCFDILPRRKTTSALRHLVDYLPHNALFFTIFSLFVLLSAFAGFVTTCETADRVQSQVDYFVNHYDKPTVRVSGLENCEELQNIPGVVYTPIIKKASLDFREDLDQSVYIDGHYYPTLNFVSLMTDRLKPYANLLAGTFPYGDDDILLTPVHYATYVKYGYENPLTGEKISNPTMEELLGKPVSVASSSTLYPTICGFVDFSIERNPSEPVASFQDRSYVSPSFFERLIDEYRYPFSFEHRDFSSQPAKGCLTEASTGKVVDLQYDETQYLNLFSPSNYDVFFLNPEKEALEKDEILISYRYFLDNLPVDTTDEFTIPGKFRADGQDFTLSTTTKSFFNEILKENAVEYLCTDDELKDFAFSKVPNLLRQNIERFYEKEGMEIPSTLPEEDKIAIFHEFLLEKMNAILNYGMIQDIFFSDRLARIYCQTASLYFQQCASDWKDGTWIMDKENVYLPGHELKLAGFSLGSRGYLVFGREICTEISLYPFYFTTVQTPKDKETFSRLIETLEKIDASFSEDKKVILLSIDSWDLRLDYWFPYLCAIVVGVLLWLLSLTWIQNRGQHRVDLVYRTRSQRLLLIGLSAILPSLCAFVLSTALWGVALAIYNSFATVRYFVSGYEFLVLFLVSWIPMLALWPLVPARKAKTR